MARIVEDPSYDFTKEGPYGTGQCVICENFSNHPLYQGKMKIQDHVYPLGCSVSSNLVSHRDFSGEVIGSLMELLGNLNLCILKFSNIFYIDSKKVTRDFHDQIC